MKFNNTPNRRLEIDGQDYWISRSVTVLAVLLVVQDGQGFIPLGKRGLGLPNEVGKWGLPGGYLDYGETIGEALRREVWEELGLNLDALRSQHRFHGDLDHPYAIASIPRGLQNVTMRFPLMFFLAEGTELPSLNPQVGPEEVEDTWWATLNEALELELAFRHDVVIRECLSQYYGNSLQPPA